MISNRHLLRVEEVSLTIRTPETHGTNVLGRVFSWAVRPAGAAAFKNLPMVGQTLASDAVWPAHGRK
jgi:hypothetical protein